MTLRLSLMWRSPRANSIFLCARDAQLATKASSPSLTSPVRRKRRHFPSKFRTSMPTIPRSLSRVPSVQRTRKWSWRSLENQIFKFSYGTGTVRSLLPRRASAVRAILSVAFATFRSLTIHSTRVRQQCWWLARTTPSSTWSSERRSNTTQFSLKITRRSTTWSKGATSRLTSPATTGLRPLAWSWSAQIMARWSSARTTASTRATSWSLLWASQLTQCTAFLTALSSVRGTISWSFSLRMAMRELCWGKTDRVCPS